MCIVNFVKFVTLGALAVFVVFFFIKRLPPNSPLFPYTTLFRSLGTGPPQRTLAARFVHPPVVAGPRDRKSTRLNSSHVAISYAVFCLKKKSDFFCRVGSPHRGLRVWYGAYPPD